MAKHFLQLPLQTKYEPTGHFASPLLARGVISPLPLATEGLGHGLGGKENE